ncbi:aldehyde dehydrogenase family protein, partial [Lichenihabitans sp. Uapishka_5]|uniref:aldehyde dehydrogenase family protein n=1 Tax=Lichenihabitans sp. Uapishka_5 TaxID=3037302 RepID=UPI0029E80D80
MNHHHRQFFIDGAWVEPAGRDTIDVIDPATEEAYTAIAAGGAADVDRAVAAARAAFPAFAQTSRDDRLALLRRILALYNERIEEIAQAVSREMGAPIDFARSAQAFAGQTHLEATI